MDIWVNNTKNHMDCEKKIRNKGKKTKPMSLQASFLTIFCLCQDVDYTNFPPFALRHKEDKRPTSGWDKTRAYRFLTQ